MSADTGINTADNSSNGHNNPATDSDTWQIGSQNTKEYDVIRLMLISLVCQMVIKN